MLCNNLHDNYAASFNCTPLVGRHNLGWAGASSLSLGPPAYNWCFSFAPDFQRCWFAPRTLNRRADYCIGLLIVYPCSGVLPCRLPRPRRRSQCSNIFSCQTTGPIRAKLHVEHPRNETLYKMAKSHDQNGLGLTMTYFTARSNFVT